MLIQYIRSHHPYWRPFLHPQLEDAPCRGDRDPVIIYIKYKILIGVAAVLPCQYGDSFETIGLH